MLGICPIDSHQATWSACFDGLVAKSILVVDSTFVVRRPGADHFDEQIIRFSQGYMAEVVKDGMLGTQQALLQRSISDCLEREDTERRRLFLVAIRDAPRTESGASARGRSQDVPNSIVLKSGYLAVKKRNPLLRRRRLSSLIGRRPNAAADSMLWKKRWAVLYGNRIAFFHDQNDQHASETVLLPNAR